MRLCVQAEAGCCACFAGLLLSSLALHMAAAGQRLVPEPLTFAITLLFSALSSPGRAVESNTQQWLLPVGGWSALSQPTPPLNLPVVLGSSPDDALFQTDSFRGSLLQAALGVISRASQVFSQLVSFPELFGPAVEALASFEGEEALPLVSPAKDRSIFQQALVCLSVNNCELHTDKLNFTHIWLFGCSI